MRETGDEPGTRFRVYPQAPFLHPGRPPETVLISTPPGMVGPGPSDHRVYIVNPIGKHVPYGLSRGRDGRPHVLLPPWRGPMLRPVRPGPEGHFDHIPENTPEFAEAHLFAVIRFTLDVWERYYGQPIRWHFARDFDRLEVAMLPEFDNAWCGYGYMEVGAQHRGDGTRSAFALNFDVIAHELGHLVIYGTLGVPAPRHMRPEYMGFQESGADVAAMLAALNFETVIDDLLEQTRGNLYAYNELNRFGELSGSEQVRMSSNSVRMSEFAAGWDDEHALSQPLTGAIFDIMVDIFQENLVTRGLISREIADLADRVGRHPEDEFKVRTAFDAAYPDAHAGFREALVETRDYLGVLLAETWKRLSPDDLDYVAIAETILGVDRILSGGCYREEMLEAFEWREIGRVRVGPRLKAPDEVSHAFSARAFVPTAARTTRVVRSRRQNLR